MRARRATAAAFVALALLGPSTLAAQATTSAPIEPEVRADVIAGDRASLQAGAGVQVPFGYYVRLGIDGAAGARLGGTPAGGGGAEGRVDLLTRFLLDPFRQSPYGVSAGAGLSARFARGERTTPLLLVAIDVEGRRSAGGWVPALQVGLGGGARVGLVLRRADPGAR